MNELIQPGDPGWYERPNVQPLDTGAHVYRASSVMGACAKRLAIDAYMAANPDDATDPTPPPPQLVAAMEESAALEQQAYELWWDEHITDGEWIDGPAAEHVMLELGNGDWIEGTTDYSIIWKERQTVLRTVEIKCVGEKLFDELEATEDEPWRRLNGLPAKYRWQVAVYAHGLDRPCYLAVCEKKNGALTGRTMSHLYYPMQNHLIPGVDDMNDRATGVHLELHTLYEALESYGAGIDDLWPFACWQADASCPWAELCQHHVPVGGVINELAALYRATNDTLKETAKEVAGLKSQLQAHAEQYGGRIVTPDGTRISVTEAHIPERVTTTRAHTRTTVRITEPKEDT